MDKAICWILLFFLALIDGCMLSAVAGFDSLVTMAIIAPIAVLTIGFGLDICREICRKVLLKVPDLSEFRGTAIMIICLSVMPLPLMFVLASINILLPGHLGHINGLYESWRAATGLTVINAFLRMQDFPVSLHSIEKRFLRAYISKDR